MIKNLKRFIFLLTAMTFLFTCFSCYADEGRKPSLRERIQQIQTGTENSRLNFAFYLDSEGHENFEQKILDEIVKSIQEKVPYNVTVVPDGQFLADFDLYRETRYDELMEEMEATNPQFAVLGDYDESGRKIKLTKKVLSDFFQSSQYDGLVLVRIDLAQVKQNYNFWVGGIDTKAELDVTIRVFNKNSPKGFVFNTRQRVVGKSHAMGNFSADRAARKAIPKALEKIKTITVE